MRPPVGTTELGTEEHGHLGTTDGRSARGAEGARGFLAESAPGRDSLLGKGKNSPTFGILDGSLTLGIAQWFVPGGG